MCHRLAHPHRQQSVTKVRNDLALLPTYPQRLLRRRIDIVELPLSLLQSLSEIHSVEDPDKCQIEAR
jgi:hypothetical protein